MERWEHYVPLSVNLDTFFLTSLHYKGLDSLYTYVKKTYYVIM